MEEVLGPLAMFEVASATAAEALPLSEPAAIAALSGADKLVMRARLQVGRNPPYCSVPPRWKYSTPLPRNVEWLHHSGPTCRGLAAAV